MTIKRTTPWLMLVALAVTSAVACEDSGPTGPSGPGVITVELASPGGPEGSAVFEVSGGGGFTSVAATGAEVYYDLRADLVRVVVIMDGPGQIRFRLGTADVGDLPTVTVLQVADGDDQLRSSLAGYEVELFPVEEGGAE
jgi:hypothetical protein